MFGLGLVILIYDLWRGGRAEGFTPTFLWIAFAGAVVAADAAVAFAGTFAGVGAFIGVIFVAVVFGFAAIFASAGAIAVAVTNAVAVTDAGAVAVAVAGGFAFVLAVYAAVATISERSIQKGRQGVFLSLFVPTLLLANFAGAYVLSTIGRLGTNRRLVGGVWGANARQRAIRLGGNRPHRALLRRGLAPGGRGPYFYALIIVAMPLIMLLAFVTIVAVQTFDDIAVLRAGPQARILPLGPLFEGLENKPGDPKFWWVWLMLFSTLIPSLFNLVIGAAAFLRGLPFMNNWILSRMPIGKATRDNECVLVASALAGQLVGGMLISGVLLYLLADYVVPLGLPALARIFEISRKRWLHITPRRD